MGQGGWNQSTQDDLNLKKKEKKEKEKEKEGKPFKSPKERLKHACGLITWKKKRG